MLGQLKAEAKLQILKESEQEYYMAVVKSVNRDCFIVNEPVSGGKGLEMPQFSTWQFCLLGEDAVYFFTSRVVNINRDGAETRYEIKIPDTVHRQQRRGHVRVPCHHDLLYWLWSDTEKINLPSPAKATRSIDLWDDPLWINDYLSSLSAKIPGKNAFTLDMSGGGLRMVTLVPIERHERLLLKIKLDEPKSDSVLLLESKVVRVVPLKIGGWNRYRVGVSFINMNEKVQEKIISYLFKQMRKKL